MHEISSEMRLQLLGYITMDTHADPKLARRGEDLIGETEKALREGNREHAYQLSLQATKVAPDNTDAWLFCATLAPSLAERVFCVNHLNELAPGYQDRHGIAFFAFKELFDE